MTAEVKSTETSIFIVKISMGSGNKGSKSKDITEYIRETEYTKPKSVRQDLNAIRQTVNVVRKGICMSFYDTYFTSAAGRATLIAECARADREMKKIDSTLHVTPKFYEQTINQLSAGSMFEDIKNQMNREVYQRVLDRIEQNIEQNKREDGTYKPFTTKSKTALLKMMEQVKDLIIIPDENLSARIEAMKAQILEGSFIPMRDEILANLEDLEGSENLEISPDQSEPATHDQDDQEYESKPYSPTAQDEITLEDLI